MGMGHECGKVFVRCVGGTWSVFTSPGQESFIRDIFYALNTVDKPLGRAKLSLAEEQRINESAICRAVEICVEDHPKMISYKKLMLISLKNILEKNLKNSYGGSIFLKKNFISV